MRTRFVSDQRERAHWRDTLPIWLRPCRVKTFVHHRCGWRASFLGRADCQSARPLRGRNGIPPYEAAARPRQVAPARPRPCY
jgi:hypothetical protein